MDLYHAILMDHYRHPRNRGRIENPDFTSGMHNPSCGDSICVEGRIVHDRLVQVAFEGAGCVISQAAASMFLSHSQGKDIVEIMRFDADTMVALVAIPLGPIRIKCALLAFDAMRAGILSYQASRATDA